MAASSNDSPIWLGTCSWSTEDWRGTIYGVDTAKADFIAEYARVFATVEVDATFYGVPRASTLNAWREKTPAGFVFSAKAPKVITHEKFLEDCADDLALFLDAMGRLGDRRGPLVFQFPYFAKRTGVRENDFLTRLRPFLAGLPKGEFQFAVEVRNKAWLKKPLFEVLAENGVTLAFIDHPWMHGPAKLAALEGALTGKFAYIRWLGDRYGIEKITKSWDKPVVDRRRDLQAWIPLIKQIVDAQMPLYGYVNNHYSGHAPADAAMLREELGLN